MSSILVTGAHGQLGSELHSLSAQFSSAQFTFTHHQHLDITDSDSVIKYVKAGNFSALINCAAYTAVDKAESDKENAMAVNGIAPGVLAKACKQLNVKFVHISTDFVFDGTIARPLIETDPVNPLGIYGATKLEGEKQVVAHNDEALIIRTSWVYSSFGNNFVKTILRLCKERDSLNIIYDQVGTPTYAKDLAQVILEIVTGGQWHPGLYHYSNEGVASWYDFAIAIRDAAGLKTQINPIETSQYPTPAVRPKYSVLNKKKLKETFNVRIPYWKDSLSNCMKQIKQA
jgi:dTDP-4-dehydrorhamnose reductase